MSTLKCKIYIELSRPMSMCTNTFVLRYLTLFVCLTVFVMCVCVCVGYGFVDFDSPASAQKAVTALKATGVQAQMAKVEYVSLPQKRISTHFHVTRKDKTCYPKLSYNGSLRTVVAEVLTHSLTGITPKMGHQSTSRTLV